MATLKIESQEVTSTVFLDLKEKKHSSREDAAKVIMEDILNHRIVKEHGEYEDLDDRLLDWIIDHHDEIELALTLRKEALKNS